MDKDKEFKLGPAHGMTKKVTVIRTRLNLSLKGEVPLFFKEKSMVSVPNIASLALSSPSKIIIMVTIVRNFELKI